MFNIKTYSHMSNSGGTHHVPTNGPNYGPNTTLRGWQTSVQERTFLQLLMALSSRSCLSSLRAPLALQQRIEAL